VSRTVPQTLALREPLPAAGLARLTPLAAALAEQAQLRPVAFRLTLAAAMRPMPDAGQRMQP
jgi:hypothetical protein